MEQRKDKGYWQRFTETGQVTDYLRYRQESRDKPNPHRRIADSSKYKTFY